MYIPKSNPLTMLRGNLDSIEQNVLYNIPNTDKETMKEYFHCLREAFIADRIYGQIRYLEDILALYHPNDEKKKLLLTDALNHILKEYHTLEEAQMIINDTKNKEVFQGHISKPEANLQPIIFLSHSRADRHFSDAISDFIVKLNIDETQLIYTTDDKHGIPNGERIFDFLRSKIHKNTLMIILWSEKYLNNPTCLCELGAAWILGIDIVNIFTPQFNFVDEKFMKCPPDIRDVKGILLEECNEIAVRGLKKQIVEKLGLNVKDGLAEKTIKGFVDEILRIKDIKCNDKSL